MRDRVYERLLKRYNEVYVVEPNDLHVATLNSLYKISTSRLKSFPFKILVPAAVVSVIFLYLVAGGRIANLTSLLQYGF